MANSYLHAKSSVRKFGGQITDYLPLHSWFDQTKSAWADNRHRAILHNTFGIFLAEQVFGPAITNSDGRAVPTRAVAEQHVLEDCGMIPTIENWLDQLPTKRFMTLGAVRLSRLLQRLEAEEAAAAAAAVDTPAVDGAAEGIPVADAPDPRRYVTGTGEVLCNVHLETPDCHTFGCTVHHPTDPHADWPTHWRADRGFMERICPHGVGHPDRDHLNYLRRTGGARHAAAEAVHGCDGCCSLPPTRAPAPVSESR